VTRHDFRDLPASIPETLILFLAPPLGLAYNASIILSLLSGARSVSPKR